MFSISSNCGTWYAHYTQCGSVHFCGAIAVTEQLQYLQAHWRADGNKYQPMTEELPLRAFFISPHAQAQTKRNLLSGMKLQCIKKF